MSDDYDTRGEGYHDIDITASDDDAIKFSQLTRQSIVKTFVRGGKMTTDPDELKIVLAAANGIAQTAIGNKRVKTDEKANKDNKESADSIIRLLEMSRLERPFEVESSTRAAPALDPEEFPDPVPVPGETEISPEPLTYDKFMAEHGESIPTDDPEK